MTNYINKMSAVVVKRWVLKMADERLTEENEYSSCLKHPANADPKICGVRRLMILNMLMACWGLGTWLGVSGLFVQLPLLVLRMPEGWELGSAMAVAVQCGNLGLLAYMAARWLFPNISDTIYIYILLAIGTLTLLLNAFFYQETATIGRREVSVAFLLLTVGAALVGCTSSVLFYPYLRHYRDVYLVMYLFGEGLSGFVPSVLALAQGIGGEPECVPTPGNVTMITPVYPPPLFDTTTFLLILSGLSGISLLSFAAVDQCAAFRWERVLPAVADKAEEALGVPVRLRSSRWVAMLTLMCALNALTNGLLPSMQSFSCMPYGSITYHLSVSLGTTAAPVACLVGVWLRPLSPRWLAAALLSAVPPLAFMVTTALLSPTPPLQHHTGGAALIVTSWLWTTSVLSYARMWVFGWARGGGARGMRACGAATQLGSAAGSLLLCALTEFTHLFTQGHPCTPVPSL